jgi:uncharacterized membrane protein
MLPWFRLRTSIAITYAAILLIAILFGLIVPAAGVFNTPQIASEQGETAVGRIVRLMEERTETGPRGTQVTRTYEVELEGRHLEISHVTSSADPIKRTYKAEDRVLVTRQVVPGQDDAYFLSDYARGFPLWVMGIAFAGFVVAVARWQGATALLGMAVTTLIILRFIIPGIVAGNDPVVISVIGALVIMSATLFLAHGVSTKTAVAFGGTIVALFMTAILASLAIDFARLSGLAEEHSVTLQILSEGAINAEGLLLGGIIIGALGVLDDVTVAQASSVFELRRANATLGFRALYSRGMVVGRDHIASTVNTLFLAYAGASLPLLIILSLGTEPAGILLNREFLATEIARTIVGSAGIVAAVPITTAVAAWAAQRLSPHEEEREHTGLPGPVELRRQSPS